MIYKIMLAICQYRFVGKKIQTSVGNTLEVKMKKIFQDILLRDRTQQFFVRRLEFSKSNHETCTLKRWKILFVVLRCRGLLRTLLLLIPIVENETPIYLHTARRMEIIKMIFKNRSVFFDQIVAKLRLVYPDPRKIDPSSQLIDPKKFSLDEIQLRLGQKGLYFELENINAAVFGTDNPLTISKGEVFIYRLMHRNSKKVWEWILSRHMETISQTYFDHVYPQFSSIFSAHVLLDIETVPEYEHVLKLESSRNFQKRHSLLNDIEIWHQRFIISNNSLMIIDSTAHPKQKFVAGQWQFYTSLKKEKNLCSMKKPTGKARFLESAIFLIGRCDENWYHFLIDTFPRIFFTEKIPLNVPLIIRADIPKHFKALISAYSKRSIIEIELEEKLEIQNLYVIPARSSVFDSQPPRGTSFVEYSPSVLKKIQTLLLKLEIETDQNRDEFSPTENVALSRNSTTRNVQNWVSLAPLIRLFNFSIHDLDSNFFKDQIKTFHNARIVVAPGGAALANIVFMQEGSWVVVLQSRRNRDINLWSKLAGAMNINYIEVKGPSTYFGPGKLRRRHSDFYISPRKLRRVLSSVTASSTR
jgi:Glycosyltransferase 61